MRLPWRRNRWRPAWSADGLLLALDTRDKMVASGPSEASPYRVAGALPGGPGTSLAALVYAGRRDGEPVIRRIEIDPDTGKGWLLWEALAARLHGRVAALVLVEQDGRLRALDVYTGETRWELAPGGARILDMVRLPDGAILAWRYNGSWLEIEAATGAAANTGHSRRALAAELARGATRILDPAQRPRAELIVAGHAISFRDALQVAALPGRLRDDGPSVAEGRRGFGDWSPLGDTPMLQTGPRRLLALLARGQEIGCAAVDLTTLELSRPVVIGRCARTPLLASLRAVDGLAVAIVRVPRPLELEPGDAAAVVIHPDALLLARVERGVLDVSGWRARI